MTGFYEFEGDPNATHTPTAKAEADRAELEANFAEEWANKAHLDLISSEAGGDQIDDYSSKSFSIDAGISAAAAAQSAIDAAAAIGTTEATDVTWDNTATGRTAIEVQQALDEAFGEIDADVTALADHLADAIDAHDASAVSYDNTTSGLTADETQAALDELAALPPGGVSSVSVTTGVVDTGTGSAPILGADFTEVAVRASVVTVAPGPTDGSDGDVWYVVPV